ncbi:hypothetical protein [Chryseobacterium lathyri]|uniref:C1q domain-containing protein n=1 Tax=Chryseobacterium lathyri TaxID=395933 RepID=A0ABT9SIC0_9FLAO|nr:hypothetical protein [Chryseobacterium lathyri]MDP9959181.1 hypothetical protein [Chryseobacterium lathyri]
MKKRLMTAVISFTVLSAYGQVGINNAHPEATLDIHAKNHLGAVTGNDGILVPRVNDLTANGTKEGQLVYLINSGFHYWNGSAWTLIGGDPTKDAWVDDAAGTAVKLGANSDGTARVAGTDFTVKDDGRVGIGTDTPYASAALEIVSSNKGVLLPKVHLLHHMDTTTVANPKEGTLVYNTNKVVAGGQVSLDTGYCFWNGTNWRSIYTIGGAAETYVLYLNKTIDTYPHTTSMQWQTPIRNFTDYGIKPHTGYTYDSYTGRITVPEYGDYEVTFNFCESNLVVSGSQASRILGVTDLSGQWKGRVVERRFPSPSTSYYFPTTSSKTIVRNMDPGQSYMLKVSYGTRFDLQQVDYTPNVNSPNPIYGANATYIEIRKIR